MRDADCAEELRCIACGEDEVHPGLVLLRAKNYRIDQYCK